jgi:hypothetical protein
MAVKPLLSSLEVRADIFRWLSLLYGIVGKWFGPNTQPTLHGNRLDISTALLDCD